MPNELTPIPSFPGYSITRDGRVWSLKSSKWMSTRVSKGSLGKGGGYITIGLRDSNGQRTVGVHRLLLETFVGPCPAGKQCRHLDGNRRNNALENLCWGTPYENVADGIAHGTHKVGTTKLTEYKVSWIKQLLATGRFTNRRIAKVFNVSSNTISDIKTGKHWTRVA